ncbi:MAG TPA: hypothetical protein VM935_02455 [Chitinophagaceae bacterium]|nr:hypothetical protein [Chitinophagaceae bacterium]
MKKLHNIIKALVVATLFMYLPATAQTELSSVRTVNAENKVAVLPLTYIGEGNDVRLDEMRYLLQNIAYRFLQEKAMELKFQSPAETNALLLKNGVTAENFRKFTPKELSTFLGVEYIITGLVNQQVKGLITNRNTSQRFSERDYKDGRRRDEEQRSSQTRSSQDVSTNIDLSIYNDKGEEIFSRSRESILSDADAYKNAIHYVLKRSPLYKR